MERRYNGKKLSFFSIIDKKDVKIKGLNKNITLVGHTEIVYRVEIYEEYGLVATVSKDNTARIWNIHTGLCLFVLNGHIGSVFSIDIFLENNRIITGGADNIVKMWDFKTTDCIKTITEHPSAVNKVDFVFDGNFFISMDWRNTFNFFDTETGFLLMTSKKLGNIDQIISSKDGQIMCKAYRGDPYYTIPYTPVSLLFLIILLQHKFIFLYDETLFLLFELFEEYDWFV